MLSAVLYKHIWHLRIRASSLQFRASKINMALARMAKLVKKLMSNPVLVLSFWGTAQDVVSEEGISIGPDKALAKVVQYQKQKRVNLIVLESFYMYKSG